jgi:hypothetical protein
MAFPLPFALCASRNAVNLSVSSAFFGRKYFLPPTLRNLVVKVFFSVHSRVSVVK